VDLALRAWALGGDPAQRDRLEMQMAAEIVGEIAAGDGAPATAGPAAATAAATSAAAAAGAGAGAGAGAAAAAAAAAAALVGWGHGATGAWGRVPDATTPWTEWLAHFDQQT
jgi:hypothetical protein